MAKTDFKSHDQYIAAFPMDVQEILKAVRNTIRDAVPDAQEVISYQLPAFKLNSAFLYFGGFKEHFSLSCPPPFTVFELFKKELAPYEVSKSAIRIPYADPLPVRLIAEIATFRAQENRDKGKPTRASVSKSAPKTKKKSEPKKKSAPKKKRKKKSASKKKSRARR